MRPSVAQSGLGLLRLGTASYLDLSNPESRQVVSHNTTGLRGGVHNVWIERLAERDYVFVAVPHGDGEGLHILDVTERASPAQVSLFHGG